MFLIRRIKKALTATNVASENASASSLLPPEVRVSVTEDGVVFLNLRNGAVFGANSVGAAIWQRLLRRADLDSIATAVSEQYNAPRDEVLADISRFIAQLKSEGILARLPETATHVRA